MDTPLRTVVRTYLIPTLGFAAIAGGIRDLGGGARAVLSYARAEYPVSWTPPLTPGIGMIIIGLGSVAIGYRAVRHPNVVPLTMLSVMITFLTWQIGMTLVSFVLPPPHSLSEPITGTFRLLALLDLASFVGAYSLFRAIRRALQKHRRLEATAIVDGSAV